MTSVTGSPFVAAEAVLERSPTATESPFEALQAEGLEPVAFEPLAFEPESEWLEQEPELFAGEGDALGVLHTCRSGEGPPAGVADPQGQGPHPLVFRGTTARSSRNPTVGHAQQLLNRFLLATRSGYTSCVDQTPQRLAYIGGLRDQLRRRGQDPLLVDCRFGVNTDAATRMFQACHGLVRDGKIGPATWSHLVRFHGAAAVNPPDGHCSGPEAGGLDLEEELEAHATAEDEARRVRVEARLSLYQNAPETAHRNHFQCGASRQAARMNAFADPRADACTPGRIGATSYSTGAEIVGAISAARSCLDRRVDAVHVFSHSGTNGVYGAVPGSAVGFYMTTDATSRAAGARAVADVPVADLAEDVVFVLHGCSTAEGTDNFARTLYRHLAVSLRNPKVFGHHNSGCASRDNSWREYSARAPDGRNVRSIAPHYTNVGCCTARRRETFEPETFAAPATRGACCPSCAQAASGEAETLDETLLTEDLDVGESFLESFGSTALTHVCRPGEGPPAAVPDPEGGGLHPLVYQGVEPRRSRNTTVGHAQQALNRFLDGIRRGVAGCVDPSAATRQYITDGLDALRRNGQDPLIVDCRFGPNTAVATRIFQACTGLVRDGKIGPQTWARLSVFAAPPVPPPLPSPPPLPPVPPPSPVPAPPSPAIQVRRPARICCLLHAGSLGDPSALGPHASAGAIVYTARAGFVDIAHLRDTADLTAFAFQEIARSSGAAGTPIAGNEGTATLTTAVPQNLWLDVGSAIADDDGLAHEILTYDSGLPGHHNSSFSPEDLVSNHLGTLVAARALAAGGSFPAAAERETLGLLAALGAQPRSVAEAALKRVTGRWIGTSLTLAGAAGDRRHLLRRSFDRARVWQTGHAVDGAPDPRATAPSALAVAPYDYVARGGLFGTTTLRRGDFAREIARIKADAASRYGAGFDMP